MLTINTTASIYNSSILPETNFPHLCSTRLKRWMKFELAVLQPPISICLWWSCPYFHTLRNVVGKYFPLTHVIWLPGFPKFTIFDLRHRPLLTSVKRATELWPPPLGNNIVNNIMWLSGDKVFRRLAYPNPHLTLVR